jgi:hypothetical protein
MSRLRILFSLALHGIVLATLTFVSLHERCYALGDAAVLGISPSATDVSAELPPVPARLSLFGWQGTPNTTYTVTFSTSSEPALVVGVGATIESSSFDGTLQLLTVTARYSGAGIIAPSSLVLPENAFLIALDPGISSPPNTVKSSAATSSRPCYGPASQPSTSDDTSGDFGDDNGLLDPPTPSTADLTIGFPSSAPGSYLSTNSFLWCVIPSDSSLFNPGVKVIGGAGKVDQVKLFLSNNLINANQPGSTSSSLVRTLALFSEGFQVSTNIRDTGNGLATDASLLFEQGNSSVGQDQGSSNLGDQGDSVNRPTKARGDVTRSFEVGIREIVSLAPTDVSPSASSLGLFGFVADETLFGEVIELVRIQNIKCPSTQSTGTKGVVIGRDTISPTGGFNLKIPTSAAFPNNNKTSNLVTRIVGNQSQQSRQISLTNQTRNSRK